MSLNGGKCEKYDTSTRSQQERKKCEFKIKDTPKMRANYTHMFIDCGVLSKVHVRTIVHNFNVYK